MSLNLTVQEIRLVHENMRASPSPEAVNRFVEKALEYVRHNICLRAREKDPLPEVRISYGLLASIPRQTGIEFDPRFATALVEAINKETAIHGFRSEVADFANDTTIYNQCVHVQWSWS
jgi:hypothetical protein